MSDIKSVLGLLCKHLELLIDVTLKPEYFRLAKYDNVEKNVTEAFWGTLCILSSYAVREKENEVDFRSYDTVSATKLYFAYLQYPAVEFYGLTKTSDCNRELLIALAWLLATQKLLDTIVKVKLIDSVLGRECTFSETINHFQQAGTSQEVVPDSLHAQVNNIICLNGKVNHNLKEISELISERAKLITKAHAASMNVNGLPHLNILELALMKRLLTINKEKSSIEDQEILNNLHNIGNILNTHMKWSRKEHVFFEWMDSVIQEQKKNLNNSLSKTSWCEVLDFLHLLHYIIEQRFEQISSGSVIPNSKQNISAVRVSRLLRVDEGNTETEQWSVKLTEQLHQEEEDLERKKEELSKKLKIMLKAIPSCVQVQPELPFP